MFFAAPDKMLIEFSLTQFEAQIRAGSDYRAPTVVSHNDSFVFQFEIGALHGDDADLQINGELADGWERLAFLPVANGNASLDLLHDLQIHGPLVGLGDKKATVHVYIHSIHRYVHWSRGRER